jgi:hypothetical protein
MDINDNNNETHKFCTRCKTHKNIDFFNRIIKRKDYRVDCDFEGYSIYLKNTKLCLDCRLYLRNKNNLITDQ